MQNLQKSAQITANSVLTVDRLENWNLCNRQPKSVDDDDDDDERKKRFYYIANSRYYRCRMEQMATNE